MLSKCLMNGSDASWVSSLLRSGRGGRMPCALDVLLCCGETPGGGCGCVCAGCCRLGAAPG